MAALKNTCIKSPEKSHRPSVTTAADALKTHTLKTCSTWATQRAALTSVVEDDLSLLKSASDKESNRNLLDEMSRVNRNTEYSSTTSRRGRCYQICIVLIDDDFEKKFYDFSHNVLTGVGKSYNSLCRCIHLFNEVFGSLNIFERCMQIIHITIMTLGIILVAKGGENVQRAACDLKRSLTRLNYEVTQDGRLTTMCKSLRSLLRAMSSSRLSVSSCGLFYLRMSLVTGLISFTSTYAIVVLQLTHLI
ncbi:hypothetical protein EVAR_97931_1 [Eumeta japonica]|uniref:Gustatory receptor n=1 Tax=Eumeta variegata TaxID=151549 RepID=A0A4C1XW39_EUMVA|nr:hypothetical protein EVAR_97931_1 [Eumeta japonica]